MTDMNRSAAKRQWTQVPLEPLWKLCVLTEKRMLPSANTDLASMLMINNINDYNHTPDQAGHGAVAHHICM